MEWKLPASKPSPRGRFWRWAVLRNVLAVMEAAACVPMALTWQHSERAGLLPRHHADPFYRLLIAQSRIEGVPLMTDDAALRAYDVDL